MKIRKSRFLALILCVAMLSTSLLSTISYALDPADQTGNISLEDVGFFRWSSTVGDYVPLDGSGSNLPNTQYKIEIDWKFFGSPGPSENDFFTIPITFSTDTSFALVGSSTFAFTDLDYNPLGTFTVVRAHSDSTHPDYNKEYLLKATFKNDALTGLNNIAGTFYLVFSYSNQSSDTTSTWTIGEGSTKVEIDGTVTENTGSGSGSQSTSPLAKQGIYDASRGVIVWLVLINGTESNSYAENASTLTIQDTFDNGQVLTKLYEGKTYSSPYEVGPDAYAIDESLGFYGQTVGDPGSDAYFKILRFDNETSTAKVTASSPSVTYQSGAVHSSMLWQYRYWSFRAGHSTINDYMGNSPTWCMPGVMSDISIESDYSGFELSLVAEQVNKNISNTKPGVGNILMLVYCTKVPAGTQDGDIFKNSVVTRGSATNSKEAVVDYLTGGGSAGGNTDVLTIQKLDSVTGDPVADAVFSVQRIKASDGSTVSYPNITTSAPDGIAKTGALGSFSKDDIFEIREISVPDSHELNPTLIKAKIDPGNGYAITIVEPDPASWLGIGGNKNEILLVRNNPKPTEETPEDPETPPGGSGSEDGGDTDPTPPVTPPTPPTNPDSDRNPNRDDYTPIGDMPTPLSELPDLTLIFDDGVPLAGLPPTGSTLSGGLLQPEMLLAAAALLSVPTYAIRRRRQLTEN